MALEGKAAALEALAGGRGAVVWQRLIADIETPVSAALKLIEPGRGDWVLESVESGETRGRYSLIGLDPDLMFEVTGDAARINRDWRHDRDAFQPLATPALQALRDLVAECRFDVPDGLPKALATLVGFFAYETIGLVERIPRAPGAGLGLPDMVFVRPTTILVFDRLADELFLIAPIWPDADGALDRMIETAQDRLDTIAARLSTANVSADRALTDALPADIAANPATPPAQFAAMVAKAKDYIAAGDIFQVVLSQRFSTPFDLPPFDLYRALRRINPSPFLYFLDLPGFALIGSSPEILVRVRDGEITIRPIAGTRPRGKTSAEDVENRESLLADPKERAEHLMLLDLGRNDVGRAAVGGIGNRHRQLHRRILQPRHAHRLERHRPHRPRQGRDRRAVRGLPRRHRQRRPKSPRLPDHRRTRSRRARALCRRRRLFRPRRQYGQLHRAAHRDRQGWRNACPGRRRHRRRQRPRL